MACIVCVDEVNRKSENHVFCLNIGADVRGSWLLIIIILSMNLRSINSLKNLELLGRIDLTFFQSLTLVLLLHPV